MTPQSAVSGASRRRLMTKTAADPPTSGDDGERAPTPRPDDRRAPSESVPPRQPPSPTTPRALRTELSLVEFMRDKADTLRIAKEQIAFSHTPKFINKRIEHAESKLTLEQLAQLTTPPADIKKGIEEHMTKLNDIVGLMDKVKLPEWRVVKQKCLDLIAEIQAASINAEQHLDAMIFLVQEQKRKDKQRKNAGRYRTTKIANRLIRGGYENSGKTMAPHVEAAMGGKNGPTVVLMNPNPDEFDFQKIAIWDADGAGLGLSGDFWTAKMAPIMHKRSAVADYLRENENMQGCLSKVDFDLTSLATLAKQVSSDGFLTDAGHAMWLTTSRPWACRSGPAGWPMQGYGSFAFGIPDGSIQLVMITPALSLLAKGVSLTDALAFFGTPSGHQAIDNESTFVLLAPRTVLWIPFGFLAVPIIVEKMDDYGETEKPVALTMKSASNDDGNMGAISVLTCFSASLAAEVPETVWQAIASMNRDHLAKNSTRSAWQPRFALAEKFVKEVISSRRAS